MKSLCSFCVIACCLFLSSTLWAQSSDDWFVSPKEAARIREQMKSNPVDANKVKANLEKIAALVRSQNADLINEIGLSVSEQNGLIAKTFAIEMMAKSNLFNSLILKAYASEQVGALLFYTVDKIGLQGTLQINSYETLKSLLLQDIVRRQQTVADYLQKRSEQCAAGNISLINLSTEDGLSCVIEVSLLQTKNFSEWLIVAEPLMKELVQRAQKEIRRQVSYFDFFTGVSGSVCRKGSWFCKEDSLSASLSASGVGAGRIDFSFIIRENDLSFNLNITARRQITDFIQGVVSNQVTGIDLIKYLALKDIENLSEQRIRDSALTINELIRSAYKAAKSGGQGSVPRKLN